MTLKKEDMTRHIMLDLETFGTSPGAAIISIGAVPFARSLKGGEPIVMTDEAFYCVVSHASLKAEWFTEDADTLAWWRKQGAAARELLTDIERPEVALDKVTFEDMRSRNLTLSIRDALTKFNEWALEQARLGGDPKGCGLWGNGSDFDNVLLVAAMRKLDIRPTWSFSKHRCHRTLMAMAAYAGVLLPRERLGTHHHALDDAIYQARLASLALYELGAKR